MTQSSLTSQQTGSTARVARLRSKLREQELDALLVTTPENRRYLSGFKGTAGNLIVTEDAAVLATDFRYTEQAAIQAPDFRVERIKARLTWLPELLKELGVVKVGFESDHVTVSSFEAIKKALADAELNDRVALVPTTGIVQGLRAVKDAEELQLLSRAIEIGDRAFNEVESAIRPGMTEAEVAWMIEKSIREQGAESLSFETIVGSGPNGARPHHLAAEREIHEGEPIVIDMGCQYRGYCSDLTRTILLGEPDDQFKKIYDIVLTAQLTAMELARSGMTGEDVDKLARTVIEEAGYGETFGHSLGHGVGLEVHENPGVGPKSTGVLEDGMVFTIEPGIYLTGWGGVRIEDVVVLEDGKPRLLSHAQKQTA